LRECELKPSLAIFLVIFRKGANIEVRLRCLAVRKSTLGRDGMDKMGSATRVLVVEDEFLISAMVADVLAEHGCEVHIAANANALEHLTCGAPCDVLFTDINLPGGRGAGAIGTAAATWPPGRLCLRDDQRDRAAQCGVRVNVPKPYDPGKVCVLLQQFAARH
jgi:CheY-like chemotaxis protein